MDPLTVFAAPFPSLTSDPIGRPSTAPSCTSPTVTADPYTYVKDVSSDLLNSPTSVEHDVDPVLNYRISQLPLLNALSQKNDYPLLFLYVQTFVTFLHNHSFLHVFLLTHTLSFAYMI